MAQQYILEEDRTWNEWQLRKEGSSHRESSFPAFADAVARLPDAVEPGENVVLIIGRSGEIRDTHFICR